MHTLGHTGKDSCICRSREKGGPLHENPKCPVGGTMRDFTTLRSKAHFSDDGSQIISGGYADTSDDTVRGPWYK